MATVIEELIITLGLDPKKLNDEQKRALKGLKDFRDDARKTAVDAEAQGQRIADGVFGKIKGEALGLFAVLVGANSLKQFVANQVDSVSALGRAAKAAGVAVQDLASFGNMIEANGGKADSARASLQALAQVMEDWRTLGKISPDMLLAMGRIGAGPSDDPVSVFMKFSKWAQGKDPRLVAQEGNMLGFDEAATNEAMKGAAQAMRDFADAKARGVPTDDDVKKLTELQNAFRGLRQEVTGAARALLVDFAPAMTKALDEINMDMGGNPHGQNPTHQNIAGAYGSLFSGIWHMLTGKGPLKGRIQPGDAGYQPPAGGAPAPAATAGAPAGTPPRGQGPGAAIEWFFRSRGFSAEQARGIAAGIFAESGFDPNATNARSGAYGLGQWLGKRKAALFAKYGPNPGMAAQLLFLLDELRGGDPGGKHVRGAASEQETLEAYITKFMRPAPGGETIGDLRRGARYLGIGGAGLAAAAGNTLITGNTTTVHIDTITVNTRATDAVGVAKGVRGALTSTLTAQSNGGLTG